MRNLHQALASFQHGFLGSEKYVVLNNFEHLKVYGKILCPVIFWTLMFVEHFLGADVMPQYYIGRCYALANVIAICVPHML